MKRELLERPASHPAPARERAAPPRAEARCAVSPDDPAAGRCQATQNRPVVGPRTGPSAPPCELARPYRPRPRSPHPRGAPAVAAWLVAPLIAPLAASAQVADTGATTIDARLQAEIAQLRAEEQRLALQWEMVRELEAARARIEAMRQEMIQYLAGGQPVAPGEYAGRAPAAFAPSVPASAPAPARAPSAPLPPIAAAEPAPGLGTGAATGQSAIDERDALRARIAAIESELASALGGAFTLRSRSGTQGQDALDDLTTTFDASTPLGDLGTASVTVRHVELDARGRPAPETAEVIGTSSLQATPPDFPNQRASGTGITASWTGEQAGASIGLSPRGFPVENVLGHIYWQPFSGPLRLEFAREPLRDSLLSYAGIRDPRTGQVFGGVVANTLRAGVSTTTDNDTRVSGAVEYSIIEGENVARNTGYALNAAVDWPLSLSRDQSIRGGLDLLVMSYRDNLGEFTFGHGGYFSPQLFVRPSATLSWTGAIGDRTRWNLLGRLGFQTFRKDAAPFFPNDPALQAQSGRFHDGERVSGLAYGLEARLLHRFTPRLSGGGWVSFDNSRNFEDLALGAFLRYHFADQRSRIAPQLLPGWALPAWRRNDTALDGVLADADAVVTEAPRSPVLTAPDAPRSETWTVGPARAVAPEPPPPYQPMIGRAMPSAPATAAASTPVVVSPPPATARASDRVARPTSTGSPPSGAGADGWVVQLGAFGERRNAERLVAELNRTGTDAFITDGGRLHRVQVGPFADRASAERAQQALRRHTSIRDAIVVALERR